VSDGEAHDPRRILGVVGLVEDRPGEAEVGDVPEVLAPTGLLHETQPVGQVEIAHAETS
jgi:hypothetical protein